MRIYHISSAPFSGGAARAAFRLHEGLLSEPGVESLWIDPGAGAHGEGVHPLETPRKPDPIRKRLSRRKWSRVVSRQFACTTPPTSNPVGWGGIGMLENLPTPDVWNLHWVSWFLDWETMLPWMAERAPIVWTLHDLNPLKGIWHYDPLPGERTSERMKHEQDAMAMKRRALEKIPRDRLTFVGPSRWMAEECQKSPVTHGFRVEHIPYGLDTGVFTPRDPSLLRTMFGIPADSYVIGFVADNIDDPRKGMKALLEALLLIRSEYPGIHLVTVGNGDISCGEIAHTHLGPIQSDRLISFFYSACDLFVCPSLQDNLPNTVLESMACSTPVVGYRIGGLPDMLQSGIGMLADPSGGSSELGRTLLHGLKGDGLLRSVIREHANSRYSLGKQSAEYLSLYCGDRTPL